MPKAYAIRRCPFEGDVILKFNKTTQFNGDPGSCASMWHEPEGAPSYWGEFDLGYVKDGEVNWDYVVYRSLRGLGLRVLSTWSYTSLAHKVDPACCFLLPVPFTLFRDPVAGRAYLRDVVDVFLGDMQASWYNLVKSGYYDT